MATYEINILGEAVKVKNEVAVALAEQYADKFPHDKKYVMRKVARLRNQEMADSLMEWYSLDDDGQRVLAHRLQIPIQLLQDTCEGIRSIYNNFEY